MRKDHRADLVRELLNLEGIKASIYMPTHRAFPDNKKDTIVYKNLLQDLEKTLAESYPRREWEGLLSALYHLLDDIGLWNHTADGLGVLAVGERVETFSFEHTVEPSFTVGAHFYLLPLFLLSDVTGHAFLADISRDRFSMYSVLGTGIHEINPPEIESSFTELFDDYDSNSTLRTGSYRGLGGAYHGQGGRARQAEIDRDKYFRYLDSSFQKMHAKLGVPVIIAGTGDSVTEFMRLAKGGFYLQEALTKPLESLEDDELAARLQSIMAPYISSQLEGWNTVISNKRNEGRIARKPEEILEAAERGGVEMLILLGQAGGKPEKALQKAAEETLKYAGTLLVTREGELDVPEKHLALLRSQETPL